ncbi:MAG TPA: hypothetical protein VL947_08330, partial [Cytophagales bacterium]|nr:hypothetical protein [Cytophagales bacterium]
MIALSLWIMTASSCHLIRDNEGDPSPKSFGVVKGIIVYSEAADSATLSKQPLPTKIYFAVRKSCFTDEDVQVVDSTFSNASGIFEKQLPPGLYSVIPSFKTSKYYFLAVENNGECYIHPVEVQKGKVTHTFLHINT